MHGFVNWLKNNAWLSGTILIGFGLVMCLLGQWFFRIIMGLLGCLVGFLVIMYFSSLFGWFHATWSTVVLTIVAIIAGLGAGWLIFSAVPFCIGLLGIVAGFFGGAALYSLILGMTGYDALWMLITLCVLCAIAGGFLSFYFKMGFLNLATSMIGAYMFMRGTTFYFGHYPSEMEMFQMIVDGEEVKLGW